MSRIFNLYGEQIKELREKGYSARKIAMMLGVGETTVSEIIRKHGFQKAVIKMTEEQKDVLIGTIIGDGCLFTGGGINYRLNLAHSNKQKDYFMFKFEILKDIVRSKPREREWVDKRTGKTYREIRFQSKTHPIFTKFYNSFYKSGKKIINYEQIKDRGELCLAIKFFDDGSKHNNGYYIAMDDFDKESITNFQKWIIEKFNITTNLHKGNRLYIPVSQASRFKSIVEKYATDDVAHKL